MIEGPLLVGVTVVLLIAAAAGAILLLIGFLRATDVGED
jgi:hypothetical protein